MAIYRLSVKIGKPFSGRAHYDYISGDGKYKRIGTDDDIQNHNHLIFLHGRNLIEISGKKKKKKETDIERLS